MRQFFFSVPSAMYNKTQRLTTSSLLYSFSHVLYCRYGAPTILCVDGDGERHPPGHGLDQNTRNMEHTVFLVFAWCLESFVRFLILSSCRGMHAMSTNNNLGILR